MLGGSEHLTKVCINHLPLNIYLDSLKYRYSGLKLLFPAIKIRVAEKAEPAHALQLTLPGFQELTEAQSDR